LLALVSRAAADEDAEAVVAKQAAVAVPDDPPTKEESAPARKTKADGKPMPPDTRQQGSLF